MFLLGKERVGNRARQRGRAREIETEREGGRRAGKETSVSELI